MYNKANLIGHLGKDPETRYGQDGAAIVNVSIATKESWKDKAGEKQEKTEWHKLVFFGRVAEIATEYLRKGALVFVSGRIQTRKWQNKDGVDQYTTEIVVQDMKMLGGKSAQQSDNGPGPDEEHSGAPAASTGQNKASRPAQQPRNASSGGGGSTPPNNGGKKDNNEDWDDDIPFVHPWGVI